MHEDFKFLVELTSCSRGDASVCRVPVLTLICKALAPQGVGAIICACVTNGIGFFILLCTSPSLRIRFILPDIGMSLHNLKELLQEVQVRLESQPGHLTSISWRRNGEAVQRSRPVRTNEILRINMPSIDARRRPHLGANFTPPFSPIALPFGLAHGHPQSLVYWRMAVRVPVERQPLHPHPQDEVQSAGRIPLSQAGHGGTHGAVPLGLGIVIGARGAAFHVEDVSRARCARREVGDDASNGNGAADAVVRLGWSLVERLADDAVLGRLYSLAWL